MDNAKTKIEQGAEDPRITEGTQESAHAETVPAVVEETTGSAPLEPEKPAEPATVNYDETLPTGSAPQEDLDPTMSAKEHGFPMVYIHGEKDRVGQLWYLDPQRADVVFKGGGAATVRPCDLTIATAGTGELISPEDSQTLGQQ